MAGYVRADPPGNLFRALILKTVVARHLTRSAPVSGLRTLIHITLAHETRRAAAGNTGPEITREIGGCVN